MYRYIPRTVASDRYYGVSIGTLHDILVVREVKVLSVFETIGRIRCCFTKASQLSQDNLTSCYKND